MSGRLARLRALSRAALWWEAAWLALWPVLGLLGAFLLAALLGLPALLPPWLHLALLLALVAGLAWLGRRAWRGLPTPDAALADRRLERDSGLAHRPLAVLTDQPSRRRPCGAALWAAHRARWWRGSGDCAWGCRGRDWRGATRGPCARRWCWDASWRWWWRGATRRRCSSAPPGPPSPPRRRRCCRGWKPG
jgi:hypothetical protein